MILRLVQSILLLVLLCTASNAQVWRERKAIEERAQILEPFIVDSARRYGIEPDILRVLCYLESRYRLDAVSQKGARGPMQFMPETATRYSLRNPHDPKSAIDAGARYFRDLIRKFDGRIDLALAAYNAGEGAVEAFRKGRSLRLANGRVINPAKAITGGIPPYRETREYVRSAIGFLSNNVTPSTKWSGLSPSHKHNDIAHTSRDFTIDLMANDNVSSLLLSHKVGAVFIEIP